MKFIKYSFFFPKNLTLFCKLEVNLVITFREGTKHEKSLEPLYYRNLGVVVIQVFKLFRFATGFWQNFSRILKFLSGF